MAAGCAEHYNIDEAGAGGIMKLFTYECTVRSILYKGTVYVKGDLIHLPAETEYPTVAPEPPSGFTLTNKEDISLQLSSYINQSKTFFHGANISGWERQRFAMTRSLQGILQKPDYDFTNLGLLFPESDASEKACLITLLPNSRAKCCPLMPYVHFIQTNAQTPVFKIDYRILNLGSDISTPFETLTAGEFAVAYDSGSIHQAAIFPPMLIKPDLELGAAVDVFLYREDDIPIGDALAKEFGILYKQDSLGSGSLFQK